MNKELQLPRGATNYRIISDSFPQAHPIFWGPNQRIPEEGEYVEPSGFISNRVLINPKIARFIHDAHEESVNAEGCILSGITHIDAFTIRSPDHPQYGETPWAALGTVGTWYPDATDFLAYPVTLLENIPGTWGGTQLHSIITTEEALDQGYLIYWQFYITWGWYRNGSYVETNELTTEMPHWDESSDPPNFSTYPVCTSFPSGCPCP